MLLALTALAAGIAVIIIALVGQQQAATPSPGAFGTIPGDSNSSAPTPSPSSSSTSSTAPSPSPKAAPHHSPTPSANPSASEPVSLPASKPVKIDIVAIGVHSAVFPVGKDKQGGLQVPQPGPNLNKVAWYRDSPTPGQTGPAVLEGHVDTVQGPSVFLKLGAVQPGDTIRIHREDGSIAIFTVDAVRAYQTHNDFPTQLVYGGDLSQPTLRIITCSNFDNGTGHYVGNTIVFAHLTSSHQ